MTRLKPKILDHWALAVTVILVVAALSIRQIDKYMLGFDASYSIVNAGWAADTAFSPLDTLDFLYASSPDQGPLYFLLLNLWGNLVGHEIALARVLTIFSALLSLAMMYRLGREAVSPIAGAFAVIIMASNAFYGFYLAHVRFYPLLVLLSTIVIWLYLRIVDMERAPKRRDYFALICALAALVSTHAYGFLLYAVCALYHLLIARKNRRWLAVVAAAGAALALAGPIIFVMLTQGVEYADLWHRANTDGLVEIFVAWFNVNANGSPLLFLVSAVGIAISWRRKTIAVQRCAHLFALLLLGIALVSAFTGIVSVGLMRHLLAGMPIARTVPSCRPLRLVLRKKTAWRSAWLVGDRRAVILRLCRLESLHPGPHSQLPASALAFDKPSRAAIR